jgi:hypothetical protein
MTQRAEAVYQRSISSEWPAYERPAGRTWQMNPSRRGIYENPLAEAQGEWKAGLILEMLHRNRIFPSELCEVGVLSKHIVASLGRKSGLGVKIQGHEVPLQDLELNDCRADPVLRVFLDHIRQTHPAPFDVFMALDVMEHIENYHGFLRAVRSMGTYKLFHLPMDLTVQTIIRRTALKKRRDTFLHISYFTKDTIMRVLEDAGYEVLDYSYTPWRIQFCSELTGKLMKLPRQLLFAISPDTAVRFLGGYSLMILAK